MYFTQEDYNNILRYIQASGIKDSQFEELKYPFTGDEYCTISKGGKNYKVLVKNLFFHSDKLTISPEGTWVINGVDTGIKAEGPKGDPGSDGKSAYEIAVAEGFQGTKEEWLESLKGSDGVDGEDGISPLIRWNNNSLEQSVDNGKSWTSLSGKFDNKLYIKGYVASTTELPKNALIGDIYGVGPVYMDDDLEHTKPYYQMYVNTVSDWNKNYTITKVYQGEGELPQVAQEGVIILIKKSTDNYLVYKYINNSWSLLANLSEIYVQKEDIVNRGDNIYALVQAEDENQYELYKRVVSWVNFGTYNSISAGIVQELGDGENVVMSQKAVMKEIKNLNANTGISDYEEFSDQKEYKAGKTVLKDGLLYTFITDHAAGAWNPDEVEDGSLKKEIGYIRELVNLDIPGYFTLTGNIGDVVDIESYTPASSYSSVIIDCKSNDEIILYGNASDAVGLWAFIDKNDKTIIEKWETKPAVGLKLVAPKECYLVISLYNNQNHSVILYKNVKSIVTVLDSKSQQVEKDISNINNEIGSITDTLNSEKSIDIDLCRSKLSTDSYRISTTDNTIAYSLQMYAINDTSISVKSNGQTSLFFIDGYGKFVKETEWNEGNYIEDIDESVSYDIIPNTQGYYNILGEVGDTINTLSYTPSASKYKSIKIYLNKGEKVILNGNVSAALGLWVCVDKDSENAIILQKYASKPAVGEEITAEQDCIFIVNVDTTQNYSITKVVDNAIKYVYVAYKNIEGTSFEISDANVEISGISNKKFNKNGDIIVSVTKNESDYKAPKDDARGIIQLALLFAYIRGGKLILCEDDYVLNSVSEFIDNADAPQCCIWCQHYIQDAQYVSESQFFTIEGSKQPMSYEKGVRLIIGDLLFNSINDDKPLSVIRSEYQKEISVNTEDGGVAAWALKNIIIILPNNNKAITAIDFQYTHSIDVENVNCIAVNPQLKYGASNPPPIANEKCVGIRGCFGSNWSVLNTYNKVETWGFYIGIDFSGEHLLAQNISVKYNYYGFCINVLNSKGTAQHPMTFINILDEHSVCLPKFGTLGVGNKQMITIDGYNLMFPAWSSQGDITYDDARHHKAVEDGSNGYHGIIRYTNNINPSTGQITENRSDFSLFEYAGNNITCINGAMNKVLSSNEGTANSLFNVEPNIYNEVFCATNKKKLIYDGDNWLDMNGDTIYSYPTYIISGKITDKTGEAVPNANVKYYYNDRKQFETTSDDSGNFTLNNIPRWTGMLSVEISGISKFAKRYNIKDNLVENITLN